MPVLNWIGKDSVLRHHEDVPYRLLRSEPGLSCDPVADGNLIIQGDNLHALKALLPRYAGQIKCIYIDPPYNTGNENWVYSDNVNSPEIAKWLDKVVGKESEDLSRHDKWLCMMYPRLFLLKRFLRKDSVIFVSIDDNELQNLLHLMDEIFGESQRLAVFTWVRKKKGSNLSKELRKVTEYVVAYRGGSDRAPLHGEAAYAEKLVPLLNRANPRASLGFPANKIKVGRGFKDGVIKAGVHGADKGELAVELLDDITVLDGVITTGFSLTGKFRWSQRTVDHELENGSEFYISKDFRINVARYNQADKVKAPASLLTPEDGIGTNEDATDELRNIFSDREKLPFDFPKPASLVKYLVRAICKDDKHAIVLDSFAGSGTTGHAVLQLNAEDSGSRKFILVELDDKIASTVTAERVRRVCKGYTDKNGGRIEGLGAGFQYSRLSDLSLFAADGQIHPDVGFKELAEFVWFCETGTGFPGHADSPLIGVHEGRAVYLLYDGILQDGSVKAGNVLTNAVLQDLPVHHASKVIYAAACRLGNTVLSREQIVFKQIPYALET